jgi:hypothetical protein
MMAAPAGKTAECRCGCAPKSDTCCGLECLERPRFFCGQVLTEQDLNGLVVWTRSRLGLARYRDGWGVVCGLDVGWDPTRPSGVVVQPGYALACCGDDIVVCEPTRFDLKAVCQDDPRGCERLDAPAEGDPLTIGGTTVAPGELRVVDLFITYAEEQSDPQTALGRNVCKEAAHCEYGRTKEGHRLSWRTATPGTTPLDEAAARWQKTQASCVGWMDQLSGETLTRDNVRAIRARLRESGPRHYSFVEDYVCGTNGEAPDEKALLPALLWMAQDCVASAAPGGCWSCIEHSEVRLARVWLRAPADRRGTCRVLAIDADPPFRRELARDGWPAPLGQVNLGPVLGRRVEDAERVASALGVRVEGVDRLAPMTVAELRDKLTSTLFALPGDPIQLRTVDASTLGLSDLVWGERVIAVVGATGGVAVPPSGEDDLTAIGAIGTHRAATLRGSGIRTYAQLADLPMERLKELFPDMAEGVLNEWKATAQGKRHA